MAPPPDIQLCSRADVLADCFNSDPAAAAKLARDGVWDPTRLDRPIIRASAEVIDAAGNKYGPIGYSADPNVYPPRLRSIAALRAGHYYWLACSGGIAEPENLRTAKTDTDQDLQRLREQKEGTLQKTPGSRVSGAADVDLTDGGRIPRMSLGGWSRL